MMSEKIGPRHLDRKAMLYVRHVPRQRLWDKLR